VPSIVPIGPPLAEQRPPPIELTAQDLGVGRSPLGDRRLLDQAELAGRRLRHRFSQAEQAPKRQGARDLASGPPAPPPGVAAPTFTSQFLAQVIAQEVMPREARQEPHFAAHGIAAYQATAARAAVYLGPQESVRLVA